jgi:hypothetical protein
MPQDAKLSVDPLPELETGSIPPSLDQDGDCVQVPGERERGRWEVTAVAISVHGPRLYNVASASIRSSRRR